MGSNPILFARMSLVFLSEFTCYFIYEYTQVSVNGKRSAFQAETVGSIPTTCSFLILYVL